MPAHIKRTNPPTMHPPRGYTHVVEPTGPTRTIYIAGQVAFNPEGQLVGPGDMAAQTDQVFKNLSAALASAGATFTDVVKINIYTIDAAQLPAIREVRDRYLRDEPPASTLIQVPRLALPEFMIEIEAIAVVVA